MRRRRFEWPWSYDIAWQHTAASQRAGRLVFGHEIGAAGKTRRLGQISTPLCFVLQIDRKVDASCRPHESCHIDGVGGGVLGSADHDDVLGLVLPKSDTCAGCWRRRPPDTHVTCIKSRTTCLASPCRCLCMCIAFLDRRRPEDHRESSRQVSGTPCLSLL
jgi:hypothetical protein